MGGSGREEVNTIPEAMRLSPLILIGFSIHPNPLLRNPASCLIFSYIQIQSF
jgi:hypothetical protein